MTEAVKQLVHDRAGHRCEYCQLHQNDSPLAALHIEHIRPRKHGSSDDADNLYLAASTAICTKAPTSPALIR